MKKYLIFLSAVSIALFTACSSEEDLAEASHELTQEEYNAIVAEACMDSEVQIRLGVGSQSSSSITRAPLESDPDSMFVTPEGEYLGIFCLAQKNQTATGTLPVGSVASTQINWSSTDETAKFFLMAKNQAAKVDTIRGDGTDTKKVGNIVLNNGQKVSEVQFVDGNSTRIYYYPYGNWYNYHFYSYYPRQETVNVTSNKVSVNYSITGTQDIIYGKAIPSEKVDSGFNAKYLRKRQAANGGVNVLEDLPSLTMDHKLAQLRFWVKTTSSNYTTYGYGLSTQSGKKKFQISELKLTQVPTNWTLTIAEADANTRAHLTTEGELTIQANAGLTEITPKVMKLKADNKSADPSQTSGAEALASAMDIPLIQGNETPQLVGYAMIPSTYMMTENNITIPNRTDASIPYFNFKISYTDANNAASEFEFKDQIIKLPTEIKNSKTGLLPGHVYNVVIDIPVPEEIDMTATLTPWATVTVTEVSSQNINVTVD